MDIRNTCCVCGEEIPEGRQVCPKCEMKADWQNEKRNSAAVEKEQGENKKRKRREHTAKV